MAKRNGLHLVDRKKPRHRLLATLLDDANELGDDSPYAVYLNRIRLGATARIASIALGIDQDTYHKWMQRGKIERETPYRVFYIGTMQAMSQSMGEVENRLAKKDPKHWLANSPQARLLGNDDWRDNPTTKIEKTTNDNKLSVNVINFQGALSALVNSGIDLNNIESTTSDKMLSALESDNRLSPMIDSDNILTVDKNKSDNNVTPMIDSVNNLSPIESDNTMTVNTTSTPYEDSPYLNHKDSRILNTEVTTNIDHSSPSHDNTSNNHIPDNMSREILNNINNINNINDTNNRDPKATIAPPPSNIDHRESDNDLSIKDRLKALKKRLEIQ